MNVAEDLTLAPSSPTKSFFELFSPETENSLHSRITFEENAVIFKSGESGDSMYLIESGSVQLSITDQRGDKVILATLGKGEVFGELSLLDRGPRTASAIAQTEVSCLVLTRDKLQTFIRATPDAAFDLLTILGKRLRETNKILESHTARNVNEEIDLTFTLTQKIAKGIADFSGSMAFLYLNIGFFTVWIVANLGWIPGVTPFDPYPFGFLTMSVSLEAIVLSIILLLAQSLQAAKDKIRADIEYEVNINAELEITELHKKMDAMHEESIKRFNQLQDSLRRR